MKALDSLRAQLQSSPRLRMLLALVAFMGAASLTLDLRDAVSRQAAATVQAQRELARWQRIAMETEWPQRLEQARAARADLEGRLWRAPSTGQAQAEVQEWLARELADAQLARVRVAAVVQPKALAEAGSDGRLRQALPLPTGISALRMSVSFEWSPDALTRLAERIEQSGRPFVMDSLTLRRQPLPRVEAVLLTPARIEPAASLPGGRDKM